MAYILLNKSMDMNSYTGILAPLSLFGDALFPLGETITKAKAEQQVARISERPGYCLGIQARD